MYFDRAIFSRKVWIDKPHGSNGRIHFPKNGCTTEIKKGIFSVIKATVARSLKCFIKNMSNANV